MTKLVLYTYRNKEEFDKYYEKKSKEKFNFHRFNYDEIKDLLKYYENIVIDLSAVIYLTQRNEADIYYLHEIFEYANPENQIFIVKEELGNYCLDKFPFIFVETRPLFDSEFESKDNIKTNYIMERKTLYTYQDIKNVEQIIKYAQDNNLSYLNFSKMQALKNSIKVNETFIIDLTSVIKIATSNNMHILFNLEQILDHNENIICIVQDIHKEDVLKNMPLYFDNYQNINSCFPDLNLNETLEEPAKDTEVSLITNLSDECFRKFQEEFCQNLIGHQNFKTEFIKRLTNFRKLFTIKKRKVFSVFLFGESGLGKTEVGRLCSKFLSKKSKLIKINFGNYSSDHSLNNLIGSPNGYVGCDGGELCRKLEKNKTGVIVFDEFEKANRPVFDFFLELLEDGGYTDSISREYNLEGYVLIFTSNIRTEKEFKQRIPPELQSRIDFICQFEELKPYELNEYINYQINHFCKYLQSINPGYVLYDEFKKNLITEINNRNTNNLRDIKKIIEEKMIANF